MLSSLLTDSKTSPRGTRNNNSKYVLEVPRGFSVHVFKSPSPPAYAQSGGVKSEYSQGRTPSPAWKQPSYPSRPDPTRKGSFGRTDYFGEQVNDYDRALDVTPSKAQKPYTIYPGAIPDTYIYERSIASVSDLPGSPSSSSSSDTDSIDTPIERCSIRARSSVETLEATLYTSQDGPISPGASTPYDAFYPSAPLTGRPLVVPPTTLPSAKYPRFDDDDSTVVSDEQDVPRSAAQSTIYSSRAPSTAPVVVPPPVRRNSDERASAAPAGVPAPVRRNSDERAGVVVPPPTRRNSDERSSSRSTQAPVLTRRESAQPAPRTTSPTSYIAGDPNMRLPPGLQYPAPPVAPSLSRRPSTSPPVTPGQQRSPTFDLQPARITPSGLEASATGPPGKRCVRWTEDLICPSPVPPGQRRKGWYNRRGDQLWTNDGRYKSPDTGQEYPPDLACYPEPKDGWMNEDGLRIDLQHRLIPKPPLRSALKRSRGSSGSVEQVSIN